MNHLYKFEVSLTKRAIDRKKVKEFMAQVAEHHTPLGKALKNHNMIEEVLGYQDIFRLATASRIVLVDTVRERSRHLVCAGVVDGALVSLNDDNHGIILSKEDKYLVFVFTPKTGN